MSDALRMLDIAIGNCNYYLTKAEDRKDLDAFNHWFAERNRLFRERAKILEISLGGV